LPKDNSLAYFGAILEQTKQVFKHQHQGSPSISRKEVEVVVDFSRDGRVAEAVVEHSGVVVHLIKLFSSSSTPNLKKAGVVFTTLHFHRNLRISPLSQSVSLN
jgi:hypothetical protein